MALSYAVLALSWPWLQPKAELPASLLPALSEALSIHCAHGVWGMAERLGRGLPDLVLSYPVLALSWPWPLSKAELPADAAAAAAAKLLLTNGLSTGVGVTLRPDLAFCQDSDASVKVASLTTCHRTALYPKPAFHRLVTLTTVTLCSRQQGMQTLHQVCSEIKTLS